MSRLLEQVVETLRAHGEGSALIGAAALSVHGVSRSSVDTDLLVAGRGALDPAVWVSLTALGMSIEVRLGDDEDPLEGIVRVHGPEAIDVVALPARPWVRALLERAVVLPFDGGQLPVVRAPDLVLLKLYAGGLQDRNDVLALLALHGQALRDEVDATALDLPEPAIALWQTLRAL